MSLDLNALVRAVKKAAVEAVRAENPMGVCHGTVTGLSPLEITTDQKLILGEKQLILTNAVRDYTVEMTVDHVTEVISHGHSVTDTYTGGGTAQPVDHSHPYKGRKSFRVHLGLKMGEKVILVRCDGGQQFVVLDRWEAP
ncbi:MAG: DUF2577 domain-containing protein [Dysosmobacter sp.]|uniref:DUF2577 domain-containing protein n=1 Tax=Eubacteriales TaxID=186802 RepID=UPI001FAE69A4|nr:MULTISPECIES: DUF2577 domain-containing protein [Eubacteriales]MDR3982827.1 DUF2577 domain-containing protein [Dysosmobacter sp.]